MPTPEPIKFNSPAEELITPGSTLNAWSSSGTSVTRGVSMVVGRSDNQNISGYGHLAKVKVTMPDNLVGDIANKDTIKLILIPKDLYILSATNDTLKTKFSSDTVLFLTKPNSITEEVENKVVWNNFNNSLQLYGEQNITAINLYNSNGQLIFRKENIKDNFLLINDLAKGVYVFRIRYENNNVVSKSIIKH